MTQGITEAGDYRLPTDSRERYDTRSKQNRAEERANRETLIFKGVHTVGAPTEIFVLGNADELARFALEQVDGYSAAVTLKGQLRSADGARQQSVTQTLHIQNVGGTVTVVAGAAQELGDTDFVVAVASVSDEVIVTIDDENATEIAFDAVVQLEVLQQFG